MLKQKFIKFISVAFVVIFPITVFAQPVDPAFNPNKLIEDKVFSDTQTFGGAAGVQKFLETKKSVLANIDPAFLIKLKEPQSIAFKQALEDPGANLPRLRTAAELIWDASRQSGLNPQVILATLNKEQGLITSKDASDPDLQRALDHAMGFACPDNGGCGDLFPGFYYQLFGNFDASNNRYLGAAKSLMKSFSYPGGRGPLVNGAVSKVGDTIIIENTMGGFDGILTEQPVTLLNSATAALYRYTPHVFNGNYNFWRYFQGWFKYPNGSLLKLTGGSDIYIIQNGLKQLVPQFVAVARNLDLTTVIIASPTEMDNYQTDKIYGPADNTIAQAQGDAKKYVFLDNVRHQASDLVIKQRGLDPAKYLTMTLDESNLFPAGTVLPPKDGTIIRGKNAPAVYLVDGGQIKLFSGYTFGQRKITAKQIVIVPDDEITTYSQNGFVAPLDGSLVKSAKDNTVYLIQSGIKEPVLADIFKNRGFSYKNIGTLSVDEIKALALGGYAQPKDYTFFAVGSKTGQQYEFKGGTKHTISKFVAKQRGITPDYIFSADVVAGWQDGIPVAPRDGTVVKGDQDQTVYLVSKAQLRPMTYLAFKNRKITAKKITVLPQAEVDAYAKGETLEK